MKHILYTLNDITKYFLLAMNLNSTMSVSEMSLKASESLTNVEHLENIPGRSAEYSNDAVFLKPLNLSLNNGSYNKNSCAKEKKIVMYFGGDVQDLSQKMQIHRDNKKFINWSLEETANLLSHAYASYSIMVIRPKRMERSTFSCYDNFVESNFCGAPTHLTEKAVKVSELNSCCNALLQIKSLIHNVFRSKDNLEEDSRGLKLILIGFSKGVVVLNQVLHDLHLLHNDMCENDPNTLCRFSERIERMIWLDGGHNGGKDTWITDEAVLETLARKTNITVEIKVTPYQVKDERRPWIGKEEKRFRNILGSKFDLLGSNRLIRRLYFEEDEPNIDNHFKILTTLSCDN